MSRFLQPGDTLIASHRIRLLDGVLARLAEATDQSNQRIVSYIRSVLDIVLIDDFWQHIGEVISVLATCRNAYAMLYNHRCWARICKIHFVHRIVDGSQVTLFSPLRIIAQMHAEREDRTVEKIETVIDSDTRLVSREISALREEIAELKNKLDR